MTAGNSRKVTGWTTPVPVQVAQNEGSLLATKSQDIVEEILPGDDGQVLTMSGGVPTWQDNEGGGGSQLLFRADVATTSSITLSGEQEIDGVAVTEGMIVLVKNQTGGNRVNNGLWEVQTGAWTRPENYQNGTNVTGALYYVNNSDTSTTRGSIWAQTDGGNKIVGSNLLGNWARVSLPGPLSGASVNDIVYFDGNGWTFGPAPTTKIAYARVSNQYDGSNAATGIVVSDYRNMLSLGPSDTNDTGITWNAAMERFENVPSGTIVTATFHLPNAGSSTAWKFQGRFEVNGSDENDCYMAGTQDLLGTASVTQLVSGSNVRVKARFLSITGSTNASVDCDLVFIVPGS